MKLINGWINGKRRLVDDGCLLLFEVFIAHTNNDDMRTYIKYIYLIMRNELLRELKMEVFYNNASMPSGKNYFL